MAGEAIEHVNVVGTKIADLNLEKAVKLIEQWVSQPGPTRYVCVTGVHGVMEGYRNPEIQLAHNRAAACVPDGMPMTWIGRARGHRTMGRVYGPDLTLRLLTLSSQRGYTNYFYGGAEGVADLLRQKMVERFPGLQVVGTFCPPFRPLSPEERRQVIADINAKHPDFVWVGLSTPKQELFMYEFHSHLRAKVLLGVGAAFDFHTGRLRQAPRWMMNAGLEWFFRLCIEPRRLAPRYLRNNPAFIVHVLAQQLGIRHYPVN
jgi:N-acetylglucosaminyldiphosphoundecaprenol N-acetyl-beta-D-mannosaminyltransferase